MKFYNLCTRDIPEFEHRGTLFSGITIGWYIYRDWFSHPEKALPLDYSYLIEGYSLHEDESSGYLAFNYAKDLIQESFTENELAIALDFLSDFPGDHIYSEVTFPIDKNCIGLKAYPTGKETGGITFRNCPIPLSGLYDICWVYPDWYPGKGKEALHKSYELIVW